MMQKNCLKKLLLLYLPLFLGGLLLALPSISYANNCILENTFPSNYSSPTSHFGARRSGGSRWHAGVDFFYPKGTQVRIPQGCQIRLYQDGTVIWKTDPTGYGNYMFIDCNISGTPITLRYAHISQYITNSQTIEQGRTGIETASIPDHYHFEILVNQSSNKGTPVDPECVLGIQKGAGSNSPNSFNGQSCNTCPNGPDPLDFCNNGAGLQALLDHSKACYRGNDKNNPGGETVDPSRLQGTPNQGDQNVGTQGNGETHNEEDPGFHTDDFQDTPLGTGFTGNVDDLFPPAEDNSNPLQNPIVEEPPPAEPVPGNPGSDPELVPTVPSDGQTEVSGCAMDTWNAMVNQAVIETRREDILNKRFIVKSDSVLRFGCFNQHIQTAANSLGPVFSETQNWRSRQVDLVGKTVTVVRELGTQSLDNALASVVESATEGYYDREFNHAPLSGSTPVSGSSGGTNCTLMNRVWQAAKCKNFDGLNVFYTFDDLRTIEPREFPANMRCDG